ncbi:tape measure protein [Bacteroides propionicifaciens]|uniref:tape measure protein n=1 Tax=Bacteroides propionicifaciens TaxID=392838 RepID=UPI000373B2A7|nr:tape measure protein [Bacteroides propionicifaciens]
MSKRLSFSIAVNLLTENFKKGTNTVKNSLRSIQMQVLTFAAALGAGGLGLTGLISRFRDVARETSRVLTALKNVSDGTRGFVDNMRFLNDIAKKYGLEINALTGNFAKFTASATQANMPMKEQKKIYESVSRAISAFSLSASEGDGVMLALSQMMSKGKISMEELRKQMGEKLPVAIQAMAKALGVSIGQMEKLIGSGKVMSADILPKFADALNEIIPNVDTDNLETSLSRLSNTFGEIVSASGFQNKYKALIDGLTSLLQSASKNIQNIVVGLIATIGFIITKGLTKVYTGYANTGKKIIANATTAHNKMRAAIASRAEAINKLEDLKLQHAQATGRKQVSLAKQVESAKQALSARTAAVNKAHENAKVAAAEAAAIKSRGVWATAFATISGTVKRIGLALKSMWNSFAPALIVSAIIAIIGAFTNMYREAKRIRNIFSDYKKELKSVGDTQEVKALQTQLSIMNDKTRSQKEVNTAQAELQRMLGKEKVSQEDINKEVAKRIDLLRAAAEVDHLQRKQLEIEDKITEVVAERNKRVQEVTSGDANVFGMLWQGVKGIAHDSFGWGVGSDVDSSMTEINELSKVLDDVNSRLKDAVIKANSYSTPSGDPDEKELKAAEKRAKELLELKDKNAQSLIDLEENLRAKRLAQIELDYNREIATIKQKEKEWLAAQNGKLSSDQQETLAASLKLAEEKKIKATEDGEKEILATLLKSKVEYLKEYGSYQQQKLAIAEEYAKKIKDAEKEGNTFEADRLRKEEQSNIASVDIAAIKAKIDWQAVLGDLGFILEEQLKPTLERLKEYAKSDDFKNATFEDQKLIYDAINKLEKQTSGGLNKKMFSDVATDVQNYQNSLRSLIVAKAKEEAAAKELIKANEKLKKAIDANNPENISSAQGEVGNAQTVFDQAAESVVNLTTENNEHAENLKNSSSSAIGALHNLEDGLNNLSSGSLKNAFQGLGNIGEAVGGKVGGSLSKFFEDKGFIGKIIAAIVGILDILKEGIGTIISGLIDSIFNAIDGILSNILSGKLFEQIGVSLFKGVRNVLDTVSFGIFNSNGNAKEVNNLVKSLTNSNKYLITAIEKLTNEMSKSGGLKSTIYYESALNKQKEKIENDRRMLEAKMGYNNSHHSNNYYIGKAFNSEDWKKASDYVGKKVSKVGDLWKLSAEDLAKLQELPDIWEKINRGKYDQSEWLDEYIGDANTLIELTEQWQDAITDTTFDSIKGELKDLLSDFKVTTEDALESVEEFMRKAILHSISSGTYADELKDWQAEFAKAMQDGILSGDEADYLRTKYQNIFDQALIDRDEAYKAAGIEDLEKSQSQDSTRGYSNAMDQDTGGSILGRVTGIAESLISIKTMLGTSTLDTSKAFVQTTAINEELKKHTSIFYEMQQMQLKSYNLNKEMSNNLSALDDIKYNIESINRNTKGLAPR